MKALDRKLLRDLRALWSQVLTIALVVASGVAGFVSTLAAVDSLAGARERFYAQGHFADVFAGVRRAPRALAARLQALPGVADVQTSIEFGVRLSLPGVSDPIIGHLIGLDPRLPLRLNRITLKRGVAEEPASMWPGRMRPDGALPAWVSESFAQAHRLQPGARLEARINGRERVLEVAGIALSPGSNREEPADDGADPVGQSMSAYQRYRLRLRRDGPLQVTMASVPIEESASRGQFRRKVREPS